MADKDIYDLMEKFKKNPGPLTDMDESIHIQGEINRSTWVGEEEIVEVVPASRISVFAIDDRDQGPWVIMDSYTNAFWGGKEWVKGRNNAKEFKSESAANRASGAARRKEPSMAR